MRNLIGIFEMPEKWRCCGKRAAAIVSHRSVVAA